MTEDWEPGYIAELGLPGLDPDAFWIMDWLFGEEGTAVEIAAECGPSLPRVRRHLVELAERGLVHVVDGEWDLTEQGLQYFRKGS